MIEIMIRFFPIFVLAALVGYNRYLIQSLKDDVKKIKDKDGDFP